MVLRLLALLIRCYPPAFRAEFEDEILGVLAARLAEAARSGVLRRTLIAGKEALGLLSSIPELWLTARTHKESPMTAENIPGPVSGTEPRNHQPGSFGEAVLSGLPHLVAGLLIGLEKFFPAASFALRASFFGASAAAAGILIVVVLFFAWRRGWPLWSASWYLYASWILLAELSFAVDRLAQGDGWQYMSIILLAWIAAFIMLYFRLYLRDPGKAMLSIAFFFPIFGALLVDYVPGWIEGSLGIGLGLACAAAAAAIVRSGSYQLAWRLMAAVNLAAGSLIAYVSEFQVTSSPMIGQAYTPSVANFLTALGFYLAFSFGILFLPMGIWKAGGQKAAS